MNIIFIVRKDQYYLYNKNIITGKLEFPHVVCTDMDEGIQQMQVIFADMEMGVEIHEKDNEMMSDDVVIFWASVYSYTTNSQGIWLDVIPEKSNVEEWCKTTCDNVFKRIKQDMEIAQTIKKSIENVANKVDLKYNICYGENSVNLFFESSGMGYFPYNITFVYDASFNLYIIYNVNRMYAPGEKSDLYVLFANTMGIIWKIFFNKNFQTIYFGHITCEDEIDGAVLVKKEIRNNNVSDIYDNVHKYLFEFLLFIKVHGIIFGSYGMADRDISSEAICWSLNSVHIDNYICREDHRFYINYDQGISLLELNKEQYNYKMLFEQYNYNIVDGIDGKIIVQKGLEGKSYNFISYECWKIIQSIIQNINNKEYTIVCQENKLFLLEKNKIWIVEGEYFQYWVEDEKEKILNRQKQENELLLFNKNFAWKYPVSASRFEELIADLLECESNVSRVRLMGKANNQDGGRDLLIYKRKIENNSNGIQLEHKATLVIGQCKAYKNSVNKSHVTDIRDMIDHYEANGFFLAVTSDITVPLIDNLIKLSEKYEVEWWTQREIFSMLRRNIYLVDRYKDIIKILDE